MKRRFTILTAALALLTFLAVPMGMWGQTRDYAELYSADFTSVATHSYTQNKTFTLSGKSWTASVSQVNGGVFYLGCNSNNASKGILNNNSTFTAVVTALRAADATYNSNYTTAHAYALLFDNAYDDVTKVEFNWAGGNNAFQVYLFGDSGSGYVLLEHTDYSSSGASVAGNVVWTGNATNYTKFAIVARPGASGSTATNKTLRAASFSIYKTTGGGDTPTTYTVTYDANGGTGTMTDSNSPYNAGATVTVLGNEFTRTDYEFDHWNTAADDNGDSYDEDDTFTINANTTLYAQWTENTTPGPGGNTQTLTFNLSSNPGGWPTTNSTTLTNYTYTLNSVNYTFALKNVKCNSGYLMMTATAVLGLPAIEGYKLTKVVASNSSNCSTSVKVGISSSATQESYIAGGAIQTWSTQNSSYTYNLTSTEPNTMYYMYVTSKNAQVLGLELTYEADASAPAPTITANEVNVAYSATSGSITYTINNEPSPAGTLTASVPQNSWLTLGTVGATVPFTCSQNPTSTARTETVTLTYTYNTNETATATVTVTQAGNPNVVDLISDINAENTNYTIRGTVVAVNARGCVVGDGTGYINFYNGYTAPSVAVNDMVTVSGSMTSYGHIYQFSNNSPNTATITTAVSSNYDGTPAITVITEIPTSTYSSGLHLSDYFQFEGTLTKSSGYYYVAVGAGQINIAYPSTTQQNAMNALENKTVRVKGYFAGINSSNYFSVMMESVEEVASTEPYITIESDAFELTANVEEGYLEFTYGNFAPTSFDVMFCDANGNELSEDPDWILLAIEAPQGETGDFVYYYAEPNDGEARTAYFMVYDDDVYSNIVTVTQNAPVVDYVTLPFNWAGGTSGDLTAVSGVSGNSLSDYAVGNAPYRVKFDNTGDYILIKTNEQPAVVSVGIKKVGGDGNSSIIIQSSSNGSDFTDVETFSNPGAQNDIMTHVTTNAFNASDRYVRIYFNKPSGGANVGVGPITIKGIETYTLSNITGYSGEKDHYRLIASPVTVDPATAGMTIGNYDLYYFNQAEEDEWRNYEASSFNLVPGKGYLYAKEAIDLNQTYSFVLTGIPYAGTGMVNLDYTDGAEFAGFNLIGNPFGTNATLDLPYYRLNQDGSALNTSTETGQINVMEGVFVQATAATRTANFTQATGAKRISQLNVKVTRNRSAVLDNAIIRFDDGATLGKFQLNQDDTKVYFTEDNQDYAIVRSNNAGEMPVSFKAAENGNYTLSVEAENVEASYLHLIDNMTGADVDLLATPSYSFEARTTDYANRFRLVFNANGVDENNATASFAYFNGSSWTVSNMGEATLQVVDMMGRVVSTQAISGNTDINLNQVPGVYMLRLVNGENVMVQKVVVR